MKHTSFKLVKVYVLLVIISIVVTFGNYQPATGSKTNTENNYIVEVENDTVEIEDNFPPIETVSVDSLTTIEIAYPKIGKLYNRNTLGEDKVILQLLKCCLVIDRNLEAGATVDGTVDEVEFILIKGGQEIETKTDDTPDNEGVYSCRFFSSSGFLGIYTIAAVAKSQGSEIARDEVDKVIYLHIGSSGNKDPVAVISGLPLTEWQGEEIQFDASQSYDPDGEIYKYFWDFGDGTTSEEIQPVHSFSIPKTYHISLTVTDNEGATNTATKDIGIIDYETGFWVITTYNGIEDETKLGLTDDDFIDLLYGDVSPKTYLLTMQHEYDTEIELDFGRTTVNGKSAVVSSLKVEVDQSTDLSKEFSVDVAFKFPYGYLNNPNPPSFSESFEARIGYHYNGGLANKNGPHDVHTWFYFGKDSLQDPGVLRMVFNPYPYGIEKLVPLSYETRLTTTNANGGTAFDRTLSLEFDPAARITITSIPSQGKVNYNFGDETAGQTTTITFRALGGSFSHITQSFILDPLPSFMNFDLTLLGERSFLYEADRSYDLTYKVDSVQDGNLVKLDLEGLPARIKVSWGLSINLGAIIVSGFIDLDMSSNLDRARLYLQGSSTPFIDMNNFPAKLRMGGTLNIGGLSGSAYIDKYSGGQTTITVPLKYDKWEIHATLKISDGYGSVSFNLPDSSSNFVSVGLDTNNNPLLGFEVSVIDTTSGKTVVKIEVDSIATNDLLIGFNNDNGEISNFQWSGKISKFINLKITIDYQSLDFNIKGTWELGEGGSFLIELNTPVEVTFVDIETPTFKIYGFISLYGNRKLSLDWELKEVGHFVVYTFGQPIGDEFYLEFQYDPSNSGNYQYGFKLEGHDFLEITRTIMWDFDPENRLLPRIWIYGDVLPGDWTVQVKWKGNWYPVPYNPP